uniref:Uncharacterized protein n=1 Tax=Mimivirus LCMiAC01 TaxID=2506608 RepID=A0A481YZL1_9VIRU|nr:MAG: hypothetical protein LCMiAC01_02860 [Mimivirus LCMiAC01]
MQRNVDKYGDIWFDWIQEKDTTVFELVKKWLHVMPIMIDINELNIEYKDGNKESMYNFNPGTPYVNIL